MAGILLNRSRQVPAEDTPAFGGIAERFRRAGDLDRAIALCRDGLKKFPDQLSARVTLGWSLLDKGQYEEARAELERVLRRAPDNLAAIRGLAELHDRSEGAMPSMDEHREAWRSDDVPESDASGPAAASVPATTSTAAAEDPFAPISVHFSSSSSSTPEIVHTAEDAGRAAQEAASAAAMALGDSERVGVQEPASAAMAGGFELEVMPFEADARAPMALDVDVSDTAHSELELESAADNLLAASTADDRRHADAFAAGESDLAETEDLVASLQQFSVDEAATANELVLEMTGGADEAGLVDLAAFEGPSPAAPERDDALMAGELDSPLAFAADEVALETDTSAEVLGPDAGLDANWATEAGAGAFADSDDLDSLTASIANAPLAADMAMAGEAEAVASGSDPEVAGSPLTDVAEVELEPAFVPDLAFALDRSDLAASLPQEADLEAEQPQLAVAEAEPEFTPDLAGVALDGHGFDALAGPAMAIETPAHDVLAHADLAEQEPEFVPDLSAVALEGAAAEPLASPVVVSHAPEPDAPVAAGDRAEPAFVPDLSYAFEMAGPQGAAPVDALASTHAQVVAIARPRPGVLALERFLRQVEARKLQLAQGSVA